MNELPANLNDDTALDRLVDGELSATERQQLLASLDSREDGWRQCALAFLEAQSWGQQFKQIVTESKEAPTTQLAALPAISNAKSFRWLALAAAVMLAFMVGRIERPSTVNEPISGQIVEIDPQDSHRADELPRDEVSDDDAVTLFVRDTSGKNRRLRVPLIEVANFDGKSGSELITFPVGVREQLQNSGFDVKSRRRYAPIFFEQNERVVPMVVPVDDAYIVPVSRPVY